VSGKLSGARPRAALTLAGAGVVYIWLTSWTAGVIAFVLLTAGATVVALRRRSPKPPENGKRSRTEHNNAGHG